MKTEIEVRVSPDEIREAIRLHVEEKFHGQVVADWEKSTVEFYDPGTSNQIQVMGVVTISLEPEEVVDEEPAVVSVTVGRKK